MAYKNLGTGVSQLPQGLPGDQFSGEDKSFESVVIQAGKPVIDWEMNLRNEVSSDYGVRLSNSRQLPSCWINPGFLESPDISNAYSFPIPAPGAENVFLINPQNVLVNGWNLKFQYSDSTSTNTINLTAPPVGAGTYRIDLVVLEVWRALVLATPSLANKSSRGMILRHGNVKSPDAVNFADDLIDPTEAAETSARVQIQYRYRVIESVNVTTYPDGLDDPTVVANTVSDFAGPGADGNPTAYPYSAVTDDAGLWRAGTGDVVSATAFSTTGPGTNECKNVDGYVYAIPICAVFRRNSAAYNRSTNINGGALIAAGTSDRPDGLFSDQIVISDIKDLRKGYARDYGEITQKATQQIFNNSLITEHEIIGITGPGGTSLSVVDNITNSDGVRRHFSDRSVTETIVCQVDAVGATLTVDLSALKLPWGVASNLLAVAPIGTNIVSINQIRYTDGATVDLDVFSFINDIQYTSVSVAVITFPAPVPLTSYFIEISIEYPAGNGLSRNIIDNHDVWAPNAALIGAWVDNTLFTVTSDASRFSLDSSLWSIDRPHREALIRLKTVNVISNFVSDDGIHIYIPERIESISIPLGSSYSFNSAYAEVTLPVPVMPGTLVVTEYHAYRPLPIIADSYQVFYQSRAIQSLKPAAGGFAQTVYLTPRTNPDNIYVITSGSGSPDDSFPFESPSAQIPVGLLPSATDPESRLDNPNYISIVGFNINTGFVKLDTKVPYFPDANGVTLYKSAPDITADGDGRNFWPKSDSGVTPVYSPMIFGNVLTSCQRHKVASPILMELTEDVSSIGRKGTIVLVMLTNWLEFSTEDSIRFSSTLSSSCAAVYRVRGNLINPQRNM
jgi:hypothetical protein